MTRHHMIMSLIALFTAGPGLAWGHAASAQAHEHASIREIEIIVEGAYKPSRLELREGEHVRLRFIRKDHGPCTREVIFPTLNIKRELPSGQPVTIELAAPAPGEYEFRCGMHMIKGLLVVHPAHAK